MNIAAKWKEFVNKMNEKGIPVPTFRDPITKRGSVSFTMVSVSFGLMTTCVILAIGLVVNKWGGFYSEDAEALTALKEAFFMAFQMSTLSAGLYWTRKFQRDEKGAVSLDSGKNESGENPPA